MIALEEKQPDGVLRKPSLIAGATKKMALTYVFGAVCAASITVVDSLIAGVSIGQEALAAIATAGPLLSIDQILHCLLLHGTSAAVFIELDIVFMPFPVSINCFIFIAFQNRL